jgi:hypothetical protein
MKTHSLAVFGKFGSKWPQYALKCGFVIIQPPAIAEPTRRQN